MARSYSEAVKGVPRCSPAITMATFFAEPRLAKRRKAEKRSAAAATE
jgi:hypothetical protein